LKADLLHMVYHHKKTCEPCTHKGLTIRFGMGGGWVMHKKPKNEQLLHLESENKMCARTTLSSPSFPNLMVFPKLALTELPKLGCHKKTSLLLKLFGVLINPQAKCCFSFLTKKRNKTLLEKH